MDRIVPALLSNLAYLDWCVKVSICLHANGPLNRNINRGANKLSRTSSWIITRFWPYNDSSHPAKLKIPLTTASVYFKVYLRGASESSRKRTATFLAIGRNPIPLFLNPTKEFDTAADDDRRQRKKAIELSTCHSLLV